MGLFDHTLDGILDIISFGLFNFDGSGHVSSHPSALKLSTYSSLSDISLNLCV
jgi:hypothetical protein